VTRTLLLGFVACHRPPGSGRPDQTHSSNPTDSATYSGPTGDSATTAPFPGDAELVAPGARIHPNTADYGTSKVGALPATAADKPAILANWTLAVGTQSRAIVAVLQQHPAR
jgi:hypothetical protein